jgi:hypothetical protein
MQVPATPTQGLPWARQMPLVQQPPSLQGFPGQQGSPALPQPMQVPRPPPSEHVVPDAVHCRSLQRACPAPPQTWQRLSPQ